MAMGGGRMRGASSPWSLMSTRSARVARSHESTRFCACGRRRSAADFGHSPCLCDWGGARGREVGEELRRKLIRVGGCDALGP
eukprot:887539-Pleurochrysis_carterae.AAC.1